VSEAGSPGAWRRCSACKQPIPYGATYQVCSVSTCNRKRTGLVFCSDSCWEVHLPVARHREAWAVEQTAPTSAEAPASAASEERGAAPRERRRIVPRSGPAPSPGPDLPEEILIVASRLKDYVRARAGLQTSDRVLEPLSRHVRRVADEAIRSAQSDGRKTVLDRDVPDPDGWR